MCLTVELEKEMPRPNFTKGPVGIDLGLTRFATTSNREKMLAPKPLAKNLKRLKKLSKQHSRKTKGSKNRKKSALRLAKLHRRIKNIRKDFLHKQTTKLAKTKPVMVLEDLDVKGMLRNPRLSRHISDAGWREFRRMLEYKTKWYGSKWIIAPRFYPSSKKCSSCHLISKEMPLTVRIWQCENCKRVHDREENAAINLVELYTGSSPEIQACGDISGGGTGNWSTSHVSMKQEVMRGIFVHKL